MLEAGVDQSEGLRGWLPPSSPRVMAMVGRGESKTEQPLLWQICTSLQGLGHSVAVLDGSTAESADNPGLQNLLEHAHWLSGASDHPACEIVPSSLGLARLAGRRSEEDMRLQPLGHLFKNYSVVLVYARAEMLISLFPGTRVRPLVAIAPFRNSMVHGYQTLKQLLQQGRLTPTLVSLVTAPQKAAAARASAMGRSLQHCAATYLGCETEVLNIRSFPQQDSPSEDTPRLVLRLLESAWAAQPGLGGGLAAADAGAGLLHAGRSH